MNHFTLHPSAQGRAPWRQHGLGLVEILVAMAISLFLLGGVFTLFNIIRQTYAAQNGLAQLQDNQRLAMTVLANILQTAGYFPDPMTNTAGSSLPADTTFATAGQYVAGSTGASASASDTLDVRYRAAANDTTVMNCLGNTAGTSATTFTNQFTVSSNALTCNGTVLVDGVSNFKVVYGIDTTGNGSVTRYVPSTSVTDWTVVKTVRVTVTFINPLATNAAGQAIAGQPATISFTRIVNLLGQGQS